MKQEESEFRISLTREEVLMVEKIKNLVVNSKEKFGYNFVVANSVASKLFRAAQPKIEKMTSTFDNLQIR